jgi:glycosyltransferase involved in cell wall biosynthesis
MPISAFIITKNEEALIAKAILSLKNIASEIIIVDSGSSDNTVQIAESLGCQVVYNAWPGYVEQKIFGEKLCQHQWILNIDADEELSPQLQHEIEYIFQADLQEKYKGYRFDLVIMMLGETVPRFFAPRNSQIRLYNKEYISFANTPGGTTTHDQALLPCGMKEEGHVLHLGSPAYHRSISSIAQLINKINFYTTEQAVEIVSKKRSIAKLRIILEGLWWFFKSYLQRRYFVFGFIGFIYAVIYAFGKFLRLAKVYEIKFNKEQEKQQRKKRKTFKF